jgi:hypothetical protein
MKRKFRVICIFICLATVIFSADAEELPPVTIEKMPETTEEFLALRAKLASAPEGGASLVILALIMYSQDQELGEKCLIMAVDARTLIEGDADNDFSLSPKDQNLIEQKLGKQGKKKYVMNSYVQGTSPAKGYELPQGSLVFKYSFNEYSGDPAKGRFKLFVECSGATSPRPITMTRDQAGIWKAYSWQSLLVDIKPPQSESDGG